MEKYLIVVDMQKDFVDGALGTAEAVTIVPAVKECIENWEGKVIFTRDTHQEDYMSTQEGKFLPVPHCIEGTEGWEIIPELKPLSGGCAIYDKPTFGSVKLAHDMYAKYQAGEVESITLIGLCTDICVASNALLLKAIMPELPIKIIPSCCAGVTPAKHDAAIETMASCQIME